MGPGQVTAAAPNYRLLVFLTALATLMLELVISRMADFHLGAGNSYLALPIAFLGLALGSLHVHAHSRAVERFDPGRAAALVAVVSLLALLAQSVVFSRLMPVVSALQETSNRMYLLYKTLAFIAILIPPFYCFGRILTIVYQLRREEIGAIYSADFWGAALACAVTPVLFHFGGFPNVALVLLALTFLPTVVFWKGRRWLVLALALVACILGQRTMAVMDRSLSYERYGFGETEVAHAWNEHSRVAVLARDPRVRRTQEYLIVHDNTRSTVHVVRYLPDRVGRGPSRLEALETAALLRRPIRNALILFAGCGAEMVQLNEMLGGQARITGVELNPLVRDLALRTPELEPFRLREFYDLPHIDLVIDEGRHFLSKTEEVYDFIFIGSNADTAVHLTGHSRKYLDTVQAFHLLLDHLSPEGVIVFDHQPVGRRVETMKRVFEERGITGFRQRIILLSSQPTMDDLLISPSGFSRAEVLRLIAAPGADAERLLYAPNFPAQSRRYENAVNRPAAERDVMTDDRPFLLGLDWKKYSLVPSEEYLRNYHHYVSWIKITTLLVLIGISLAFIALVAFRRSAALPPSVLGYLLITGFCFMLVEVAVMAKLELFLQQPIVSMATVLSTFLLASGIGSRLFPVIERRLAIAPLALAMALLSVGSIFVLDFLNSRWLALPIALKLLVSFAVLAPTGISLGLFYPYAVSCLVRNGRPDAVAITYGISTLSSVIGATYAMTVMLDLGFANLLWQAAGGYLLLALLTLAYTTLFRGRFLTL